MGIEFKYSNRTIAFATNGRAESNPFIGPGGVMLEVHLWDNVPDPNLRGEPSTGFSVDKQGDYGMNESICGQVFPVPNRDHQPYLVKATIGEEQFTGVMRLTDARPRTPAPQIGKK